MTKEKKPEQVGPMAELESMMESIASSGREAIPRPANEDKTSGAVANSAPVQATRINRPKIDPAIPEDKAASETGTHFTDSLDPPSYISPVIRGLDASRRPSTPPVCEQCPMANWFMAGAQLKCFCGRMHMMVWDDQTSDPILLCDAPMLLRESPPEP